MARGTLDKPAKLADESKVQIMVTVSIPFDDGSVEAAALDMTDKIGAAAKTKVIDLAYDELGISKA